MTFFDTPDVDAVVFAVFFIRFATLRDGSVAQKKEKAMNALKAAKKERPTRHIFS